MSQAEAFVKEWAQVWRGPDSDPGRYMELLHPGCRLVNPLGEGTREELPRMMAAFLELVPDLRVEPTRWGETADGVLIEWVNSGTLRGAPLAIRGADRFTLRDGKAVEGYSYFDPRPFTA